MERLGVTYRHRHARRSPLSALLNDPMSEWNDGLSHHPYPPLLHRPALLPRGKYVEGLALPGNELERFKIHLVSTVPSPHRLDETARCHLRTARA